MTRTKKIPPQEWIQDYFCPAIGVLATPEANSLCQKNNLSMVELLQPFSKLSTEVTVKDPENSNHLVPNLCINFQDFHKDPAKIVGPRLLSDTVASITEEPFISRAFPSRSLQIEAPGFTPWFDAWTKIYLQSLPCVEHEFIRHHLGCVFVVSSNTKNDPMEQIRNLVQLQHKSQHERANSSSSNSLYPQYFSSNTLKYYILLHDVYSAEESRAHDIFKQMQSAFGSTSCHLLQFNSRTTQNDGDDGNPNVAEHWTSMTFSHRFSNIETRLLAVSGDSVLIPPPAASNNVERPPPAAVPPPTNDNAGDSELDHPLAAVNNEERTPPPSPSVIVPKLVPVTRENIAIHLTYNDIDRIRIMIREFVIKSLIPHCERQLRLINDIVTNRKSRSLFSGAKRWFGQGKPGVATGTSVIYGREAPELQLRKLADLFFMLKMYKSAYNHYHTAKKDFQSDEAWNYYAGSAEMCALAQFMQGEPTNKKYPAHYMEDSITKYLQVCQMPEFAIRASLFDALCLKYQGMYQESALSYVRMTNEAKDLRSALLLEQASYCYLLCNPPLVRKYSFHVILSGYRFSKSGQKKHSSRTYRQGFQVYKNHGWELAENHILYTLGHQSLLLKDHYTAASLFNELVATTNVGLNPLQQMCHLREFFIVHHMREKEDKRTHQITIPFFKAQESVLDLTNNKQPHEILVEEVKGTAWQDLERAVVENIHGAEMVHLTQTCQSVFGPLSHNLLMPQAAINEEIRYLLPVTNPFLTALLMREVKLIWKFTPASSEENNVENNEPKSYFSGDPEASNFVEHQPLDNVKIEQTPGLVLELTLKVLKPGEVFIHGIEYKLKALFPQSESTDYTIKGKQALKVEGPRLNSTKEQKVSKTPLFMKDNRLSCKIVAEQPRLNVTLNLPESMFQGQIQSVSLTLQNVGNAPLSHLYLVHHSPGLFSLGEQPSTQKRSLFDYPMIQENNTEDESFMDIIPVHLDEPLQVNSSIQTKLWICAPNKNGPIEISLYFAYNIPFELEKKPLKRLLKRNFTIKILPSINVTASYVNACLYDNKKSQGLVVKVSNTSLEIDPVYVWQVGLISTSKILNDFVSSNENHRISKGESSVLGLKTAQATIVPEVDKQLTSGQTGSGPDDGYHFSTLQVVKDSDVVPIHSAPYLDFTKSSFEYPSFKVGPKLKSDLLVLFWRSSSGHQGLIHTPIINEEEDENGGEDIVDSGSGNAQEVLSTESIEHAIIPNLKKLCRVYVVNNRNIQHDFDREPICLVPFTLVVENYLPTPSKFRYKIENRPGTEYYGHHHQNQQDFVRILGCVRACITMEGQTKKRLQFHAAVSSPGLYSANTLHFQMTSLEETEVDDDEYIPMEVNFLVDKD